MRLFLFFVLLFTSFNYTIAADLGYEVSKFTECADGNNNTKRNQTLCDKSEPGTECIVVSSSISQSTPIVRCVPQGQEICKIDTDCTVLGRNKCVSAPGSSVPFHDPNNEEQSDRVGICSSLGGSTEDNALGQIICNILNLITGTMGRGVVAIIVVVVGVLFFIGKVSWNMLLATGLGIGAMFGAPAIVAVLTGKSFSCR